MVQRALVFLAAIFLLSAANVEAGLVIDQFSSTSDQSLVVTKKKPSKELQAAIDTSIAIGGYRDILLEEVSDQPVHVDVFAPDDGDNGLFLSQGTGAAKTTVTWDGTDSPNLLSYGLHDDLTSGGVDKCFLLTVGGVTGTGINVTMTIYTYDSAHSIAYSSTMTTPVLITHAGDVSLPFSGFSGGASLTNVNAITLQLNGTDHPGSDIAITKIVTATPEPSTLMLAAVGALVFLGTGRKWRRA
jgi:hypothetical protein